MPSSAPPDYLPIEHYGLIGNLQTTALISIQGSIDFLCAPRFDSPSIFTRLLDAKKGGYFQLACRSEEATYKQLYLPDTAILVTRILSENGVAEIIDFMPVVEDGSPWVLFRQVKAIRGEHDIEVRCWPNFDYARAGSRIEKDKDGYRLVDPSGQQPDLWLAASHELEIVEGRRLSQDQRLAEGEKLTFALSLAREPIGTAGFDDYLQKTHRFWQRWIDHSQYKGRWREVVHRSAMTLKLLTSYRYGSTVAAATFGLPETIGGVRNWDYRYTWIRDAAFTMYAFLRLGFIREAEHFMDWIKQRCTEEGLQLLYAVDGNMEMEEKCLDHLEGYRGSRPVRIGNAARNQMQLDIYGELIDTIYLYNQAGGSITFEFWENIRELVAYVIEHWQDPDHGIWEVRTEKRAFLHSRVSCWVAIDRAIRIARARSLPADLQHWSEVRDTIFKDIYYNFWNADAGAYTQYQGAGHVDASALLMPLLRFVSSREPRWRSTLEAVERELVVDVLVYRYRQQADELDGIDGEEGAFTICSFWYIECLARVGRLEEAELAFEKMMGYANHLGLFSEEIGHRGQQLGNFPQAFTHLALISAAYQIDKKSRHHRRRPLQET